MNKHQRRELKEWAEKATKGVGASGSFLSLWHPTFRDDPLKEPVAVIQLGLAILLDKPIVIVAPNGSVIPENVRRVARSVKFYIPDDMTSMHEATRAALHEAGIIEH